MEQVSKLLFFLDSLIPGSHHWIGHCEYKSEDWEIHDIDNGFCLPKDFKVIFPHTLDKERIEWVLDRAEYIIYEACHRAGLKKHNDAWKRWKEQKH